MTLDFPAEGEGSTLDLHRQFADIGQGMLPFLEDPGVPVEDFLQVRPLRLLRLGSVDRPHLQLRGFPLDLLGKRSEERRVGKECVSTCKSRWSPSHYKQKKKQ